jgi:hypothetical protein
VKHYGALHEQYPYARDDPFHSHAEQDASFPADTKDHRSKALETARKAPRFLVPFQGNSV